MLLKLLGLAIVGYFIAKWFFREPLRALLGKLDRKINRVVNATLIALALVYAVRLVLWWFDIPEWIPW
jgi:hypothetical protein